MRAMSAARTRVVRSSEEPAAAHHREVAGERIHNRYLSWLWPHGGVAASGQHHRERGEQAGHRGTAACGRREREVTVRGAGRASTPSSQGAV